MSFTVEVTLDYPDAEAAAAFWAAALGYRHRYTRPPYVVLEGGGPAVVIQQVAEPAPATRVHLDLRVPDPEATVERLVGLGARVTGTVEEAGTRWTVMADPWGTPLCVCPAR